MKRGHRQQIETPEDGMELGTPEDGTRLETHWPRGRPMPTTVAKREVVPCPKCRRVRLDNTGQCCVCTSTRHEMAYFRCKDCGHAFKMIFK